MYRLLAGAPGTTLVPSAARFRIGASTRQQHRHVDVSVPDSIEVTTFATVRFQAPVTPTCVMSPSRSFSTF